MSKNKQKRTVEQVSSKSLIPPTEPDETTEADVDFSKEEKELQRQMKELKAKLVTFDKKKKQAVSGKKLPKMRKYAEETTSWALAAATKFGVSVKRANDALCSLGDYEETLGISEAKRVSNTLSEKLELVTEAAEALQGARDKKAEAKKS